MGEADLIANFEAVHDVEAENATENSAGDDPNVGPFPRRTTHHVFFFLSRFSRESDGSDLIFKRSTECLSLVTVRLFSGHCVLWSLRVPRFYLYVIITWNSLPQQFSQFDYVGS